MNDHTERKGNSDLLLPHRRLSSFICGIFLLFSTILLHAQLGLRDPAFIAATAPSGCAACPPVTDYSMWIDPSDAATVFTNTAGTVLANPFDKARRLTDKSASGTNFLVIESETEVPQWVTTNMFSTGLPGMRSGQMISSNITALGMSSLSTGALTMFIIIKPLAGLYPMMLTMNPFAAHGLELRLVDTSLSPEFISPNAGVAMGTVLARSTYAFCIQMAAASNPSGSSLRAWNGLTKFTATTTPDNFPATAKVAVGKLWGAAFYATGDWSEIIAYPRMLSGLEVTNTQNYLIAKWGAVTAP